jgi:hypothetical protein
MAQVAGQWQGGKHRGSIFKRGQQYVVLEIEDDNFYVRIADYHNETDAKDAAATLRATISVSRNLTRNRYRYVTDPISQDVWLEVNLNHGQTLVCDVDALPLVEKHSWHAEVKDDLGKLWYARSSAGFFHKLLTGFPMTDHVDRNGLNNRVSNLRATTPLHNQHNRRKSRRNSTGRAGVMYRKAFHDYFAFLGSTPAKSFAINKYGNETAFALACAARAKWESDNNIESEVGQCDAPPEPVREERLYQCPKCEIQFRYSYTLRRHILTKHDASPRSGE